MKGGPQTGLILIRALEPQTGISLMESRRGITDLRRLCSGPGKLTQALGITMSDHEKNLCGGGAPGFLRERAKEVEVVADPRIGISRAKDLPWRFTLLDSPFVSRPVRL